MISSYSPLVVKWWYMSKPIPGRQYVVQDEDTLSQIAVRAYGRADYWPRIWRANQSALRSGDPNLIFPGEVIIIPEIPERETDVRGPDAPPDKITVEIGGQGVELRAKRIIRTMDTAADAWSGTLPWEYGANPQLDELLRPFAYPPARAFIGSELLVSGLLYDTSSDLTSGGTVKSLMGFSWTIDIVDSSLKPPYEKNRITLFQRCEELIKPLGIGLESDTDTGGIFDRVTAREGDTIHRHLAGLASQRGVLISSTPGGNVLLTAARTSGAPVATLEEGQPGSETFSARFSGRAVFNIIRAIGQTPGGNVEGIARDDSVPRSRFKTIRADETMAGDIDAAARWERSRQFVDALTIPFPVQGFRDPSGTLWRENTLVTLISPSLHLPDGFNMLIRRVEFIEDQNGQRSVLGLIPPQAYTKEAFRNPWA
jgi:prophage tail gpP-like protein